MKKLFNLIFNIIFIAIFAFPIIYIIYLSLLSKEQYFKGDFIFHFTFENYYNLIFNFKIGNYIFNSLIITIVCVFFILLFSIGSAYALINMNKKKKTIILLLLLLIMVIPEETTIISEFYFFAKLGYVNTLIGVIILNISSYLPETILLTYSLFSTIPKSYEYAAKLDGAGSFKISNLILSKISKYGILLMGITSVINIWNDLYTPLLFLQRNDVKPVSLAILFLNNKGSSNPPYLMASIVLSLVPLFILCILITIIIIKNYGGKKIKKNGRTN